MIFCNFDGDEISTEDLEAHVFPLFEKSSNLDLQKHHSYVLELVEKFMEENEELFERNNLNARSIRYSYILFLLSCSYYTDAHAILHSFGIDDFKTIEFFEQEHEMQLLNIKKRIARFEREMKTPEH